MSDPRFVRSGSAVPKAVGIDANQVLKAAQSVPDPCGLLYGNGLTFGELGMIEGVSVDDKQTVTIQLLLDDPNCLYMPRIIEGIEKAVLAVDGVEGVMVRNRGDEVWTKEKMSEEGRAKYQRHLVARQQRIEARLSSRSGSLKRERK